MSFFTIPIHWELFYELSHNRQFPHSPDSDINWNLKDEWLMAHNKKKHDLQSVKFRDTISREFKQLILSLLQPNPQKRKSGQQIKASK